MNKTRPTLRGGNPRLNFLLWLIPLAFFFAGAAAQTYTRQTARLARFQSEVTYNASGTATAVKCEAFFRRRFVNDADANDVEEAGFVVRASYDLLEAPANQTTVAVGGGVTVTDAQLAAILRKRSEQAAGL